MAPCGIAYHIALLASRARGRCGTVRYRHSLLLRASSEGEMCQSSTLGGAFSVDSSPPFGADRVCDTAALSTLRSYSEGGMCGSPALSARSASRFHALTYIQVLLSPTEAHSAPPLSLSRPLLISRVDHGAPSAASRSLLWGPHSSPSWTLVRAT